jgi:hypothetical protein
MYSDIEINTLSKNQISKLLNGHPVRLMVGVGHTLAVSSEQYKKLMKAKKNDSSATITLDPYQIDESQHLRDDIRGSGVGKKIKSLVKKAKPAIKKAIKNKVESVVKEQVSKAKQIALKRLNDQVKRDIARRQIEDVVDVPSVDVEFYDDIEGEGIKDFVGMMKRKKVGRKFVNTVKKVAKNPLVKKVGEALVERAIKTIAGGKVGRPRTKVVKKTIKKRIGGGALYPAGGALYPAGTRK